MPSTAQIEFQSTLPIREETWAGRCLTLLPGYFNPLFPYGKRQVQYSQVTAEVVISIHSSHTGRDWSWTTGTMDDANFNPLFPYGKRRYVPMYFGLEKSISIHSSHTGRDDLSGGDLCGRKPDISIHSSHTGRDPFSFRSRQRRFDFNPLFPYGKRR